MALIVLQTQITAQEYLQNHYIYIALFNVVFSQYGLQEICCFLECHPTCQFRILFIPVLDVVRCAAFAQNRGKPGHKTTSQCTAIHTGMYIMILTAQHSMMPNWKQ